MGSTRAIGIVRVSVVGDREQEDRFASPDVQRERMNDLCARERLDLTEVHEELDVSGGKPLAERPKLRRAVEAVEAGRANVIVVAYFDRLVRSLVVQAEVVDRVEAAGGRVLAADVGAVSNGTAAQWLSGTMLGAVSEYVRRSGRERSIDGQARAIDAGHVPVILIPGLRRTETGAVELDPDTCSAVSEAFRLRAGGAAVKQVREHLRCHGVERSYYGTNSLLRSRQAIGEVVFGDRVIAVPALVDRDTWRRVQRVVVPRGRKPKSDRLLARLGVLRCKSCGARMVVDVSRPNGAGGTAYPMYRCPPTGDCTNRVTISAALVERAVVERTKWRLAAIKETATATAAADRAAADFERAEHAYRAAVAALDPTEPAEVERLAEFRHQRDAARERSDEARQELDAVSVAVTTGDWDELSLKGRRDLIRALIERVEVAPGRGADRITIDERA